MAGSTSKGIRNPDTGDLMTQAQLDAYNLTKFKKSLKAGTLGNTGPITPTGTSFGSGRWKKYFIKRPDEAKKIDWKPSDTEESYMSRSKNRKTTISPIDDIDTKQPTDSKPLKKVSPPIKMRDGIDDIDTAQNTDFKVNKDIATEGESGIVTATLGRDMPSRGQDNSLETKEQQRARIKAEMDKEKEIREEKYQRKLEKKIAERESQDRDNILDKEFVDFEGDLDNEKLDKEFADFEDGLKKEKLTELAKKKKRQQWLDEMKAELRADMSAERVGEHIGANKAEKKKGMLTIDSPFDEQQVQTYLGLLEKAGVTGAKAEKLVGSLMSVCDRA